MDARDQRLYYGLTASACGLDIEQVAQVIETIKTSLVMPEGSDVAVVYRVYQNLIGRNHYWDFADLIRAVVAGLEAGTLRPWEVDLILIDEF
jgi:tetrahydromethanopterin S-methyltransferase subunit F